MITIIIKRTVINNINNNSNNDHNNKITIINTIIKITIMIIRIKIMRYNDDYVYRYKTDGINSVHYIIQSIENEPLYTNITVLPREPRKPDMKI